jgi:hypothetical protein
MFEKETSYCFYDRENNSLFVPDSSSNRISKNELHESIYIKPYAGDLPHLKNIWNSARCVYHSPTLTLFKFEGEPFELTIKSILGDKFIFNKNKFEVYPMILDEYSFFKYGKGLKTWNNKNLEKFFPDFNIEEIKEEELSDCLSLFNDDLKKSLRGIIERTNYYKKKVNDIRLDKSFCFCNIKEIEDLDIDKHELNPLVEFIILEVNKDLKIKDSDLENFHIKIMQNYPNIKGSSIYGTEKQKEIFNSAYKRYNL